MLKFRIELCEVSTKNIISVMLPLDKCIYIQCQWNSLAVCIVRHLTVIFMQTTHERHPIARPVYARVSFMNSTPDRNFSLVDVLLCAISCYDRPR